MSRDKDHRIPGTPAEWLDEIRAAYEDAREAIPFGKALGQPFGESDLFHLAPEVALKFRGMPSRGESLERAKEAALSSYVANLDEHSAVLSNPRLAFAFCYLASHYGLDLMDMAAVDSVMQYLEQNIER